MIKVPKVIVRRGCLYTGYPGYTELYRVCLFDNFQSARELPFRK